MKKLYFTLFSLAFLLTICTAFVSMKFHSKSSGGITGQNGSPGEGTCSGCHGGGSNATTVTINANPAFTNNEYIQGQTYTITVKVAGTGYTKFGFTSEILFSPANTNAGVMSNPGTGVTLANGPSGRKNAIQTSPQTGTGSYDFTYQWTAPISGANTVRIYAVGNCVNGNGNTSGDFARATSLTISTPTITAIQEQQLSALSGFQVFPNPAQDQINVSYNLSDRKKVGINLCSITGETIAELMSEEEEGGMYTKKLNLPSQIASGMYFLKVTAGNKIVAQRLVSVR